MSLTFTQQKKPTASLIPARHSQQDRQAAFQPPRTNEAPPQPDFGHEFSKVDVLPGERNGPQFSQSCPLALPTPRACPFGGACHTCPAPVQAKLTISQPGDKYEQEADRVADAVMAMPEPRNGQHLQRECSECEDELHRQAEEEEEEEEVAPKLLQRQAEPGGPEEEEEEEETIAPKLLQRQVEGEEEEEEEEETVAPKLLQRQVEGEEEEEEETVSPMAQSGRTPQVTPEVTANINSLRGGGQPLPPSARAFFEPRFGHDFSRVRVHADSKAADTAQAVNAQAFTIGRDIVFGAGQYAPDSQGGRRLLAHELAHTMQQRQGDNDIHVQRACGSTDIAATVGTRSACTDRFDGTFVSGSLFKLNVNCDTFASGQDTALRSFASGLSPTTTLEIHGFASVDKLVDFNKNLGCARAMAAQKLLTDPPPGGAGIPASRITRVINHGPVPGPAANRRAVVISTTTPPPPTVAFSRIQANTSPTGMADRIPPRVDTIAGVGIVGGSPHMLPVTLSIDGAGGGNGTATIDGAATVNLMSDAVVRLRGVDQTAVGNAGNLRLVADQGGTRLAASNSFSVSAIPQNWSITFSSIVAGPLPGRVGTWRGFIVQDRWESDSRPGSANISDLDQTEISEEVELSSGTGVFAGVGGSASGFLPGNIFTTDTHATPVSLLTGFGQIVSKQTCKFHDHRSASTDIPMRNSGYLISRTALRIPIVGIVFINTFKRGALTTANRVTSAAGVGSVSRTQRV